MPKCSTLEEAIRDMESGVFDFTKDGDCSNCGNCCSDLLPISSKEIKEIKRHIHKHKIKESKHFLPTSERIGWDLTCPFRDNDKQKCTIYEVRPEICRSFKCDYPVKGIQMNRDRLTGKYNVVSVRKMFFGEE